MEPILPGPILAAEDSPDDLFLLQRAFEKAELKGQAEIVRDGVEATDYLEGAGRYTDRARFRMPSVVVLDLKMPRRSGLEVLSWMGERGLIGRIPAIILTSSSDEADVLRAYERGALSYHVKPAGFKELFALIRDIEHLRAALAGGAALPTAPLPGARRRPH